MNENKHTLIFPIVGGALAGIFFYTGNTHKILTKDLLIAGAIGALVVTLAWVAMPTSKRIEEGNNNKKP